MKIFIEGVAYSISSLERIFDDSKFYHQNGREGIILSVGYYHSSRNDEIVYMLPKVFMKSGEETIFGISKDELVNFNVDSSIKHSEKFDWVRQISVYFYTSLIEYRRRNVNSNLLESSFVNSLNTNFGKSEYSYLDLLLSFVGFYKKNKNYILYKTIEYKSRQFRKPKWDKTIRKSIPLISKNGQPVYQLIQNKRKVVDTEEELIIFFLSILNHFNQKHNLFLKINKSFAIIKGEKFESLQKNGLRKLRKIKYKYFNDTLKSIYALCEIYFSKIDSGNIRKRKEEFISTKNYNLVFEDMVDKLFSDPIQENNEATNGVSLKNLKNNEDGKIIDHIYSHQSLIDASEVFYIGDSKYYKSEAEAGKKSRYKQFTYAKNVIQYNIDLLNEGKYYDGNENIRYRDKLTEGYNISPNFFIYGYIANHRDFDNHNITPKTKKISPSFHFKKRLFDRDTLFIQQYEINFLYVLKAYSNFNQKKIEAFRFEIKTKFRKEFVDFFNTSSECKFDFFESVLKKDEYDEFIKNNFRKLIGKFFCTVDERLILAKHLDDELSEEILSKFKKLDELK